MNRHLANGRLNQSSSAIGHITDKFHAAVIRLPEIFPKYFSVSKQAELCSAQADRQNPNQSESVTNYGRMQQTPPTLFCYRSRHRPHQNNKGYLKAQAAFPATGRSKIRRQYLGREPHRLVVEPAQLPFPPPAPPDYRQPLQYRLRPALPPGCQ